MRLCVKCAGPATNRELDQGIRSTGSNLVQGYCPRNNILHVDLRANEFPGQILALVVHEFAEKPDYD